MKTTIDIADGLLRKAKQAAHERGTTLRSLVEAGLRQVLDEPATRPFKLKDGSVGGRGLSPGLRPGDWTQLRGLIYPHGDE